MASANILLLTSDSDLGITLEQEVLQPAGYRVTYVRELITAQDLLTRMNVDLFILDGTIVDLPLAEFTFSIQESLPGIPILLLVENRDQIASLYHEGISGFIFKPLVEKDVIQTVQRVLLRSHKLKEWASRDSRQLIRTMQQKLDGFAALERVAKSITGLLDLDNVLSAVVDASVELTGAEEGSLLLLDEMSGELYIRAARNFQDDFVRTFRLPIRNSFAGQVMRTGKPLVINAELPQKIKTSYLVYTLIYVPLRLANRVIGVLGVDNRQSGNPFHEEHLDLINILADYAANAVENARTYTAINLERKKFETILTKMGDGVIVVDHQGRLILVNEKVCAEFDIEANKIEGKFAVDEFIQEEMLEILKEDRDYSTCSEINMDDGRSFNVQVTAIPEVGKVITLQDITHKKELDRIKSDFVSTVSHDLRSPLTAILGYVDLLARVGPVTPQQNDFIHRIRSSVISITELINDLLDINRIEAGFDARKDIVAIDDLLITVINSMRDTISRKKQSILVDLSPELPPVLGNPVQLRQVFENLIENAYKYTPEGGVIQICAFVKADQTIITVKDNGQGIPQPDHPFIFDKFYRASNVYQDIPGTGLGLAIVKSSIENHNGRIWVDSLLNQGTIFTVVLPIHH